LQANLLKTNPRTLSIAVATLHCSRRRVRKRANLAIYSLGDTTR